MAGRNIPFLWKLFLLASALFVADNLGIFVHFFELDYSRFFELPATSQQQEEEQEQVSHAINNNHTPYANVYYNISFLQKAMGKCGFGLEAPHLTVLVKSALSHDKRRAVIRRTWGYEQRFSDVYYRCVFLVGATSDPIIMASIEQESIKHKDIIQGDFIDTYFNNTIKTMLGIRWTQMYCADSYYYMFVDDDYYVSIKNVLRFVAYPNLYPNSMTGLWTKRQHEKKEQKEKESFDEGLFAGYVMQTAPLRHKFSKWYVSLNEYPYDKWPPYVTAGAFVLSRDAARKLYSAGKHTLGFRFDDIYLGILAISANIQLTHCDMFHFTPLKYKGSESYRFVLASHGFDDGGLMEKVWTECRSAGYA